MKTQSEVISTETVGRPPQTERKANRRQRGIKQGVLLMLLSVILIPAYFLLAPLFPPNDRLIESAVSDTPFEKISQAVLITIFLLGLVRASSAWFSQKESSPLLESTDARAQLPGGEAVPVTGFGAWREEEAEAQMSKVQSPQSKVKNLFL